MDNEQVLAALQESMTNLQPLYGEEMTKALEKSELEPPAWYTLVLINGLSEPVGLDQFRALSPFISMDGLKERIQLGVDKGFIEEAADAKGYLLTESGRKAATHPFDVVHKQLDDARPIDAKKLNRLAELFSKIVDTTLSAEQPTKKPNLQRSRTTQPGAKAGPVTLIDQYITDLIAYRDDAHNAAWLPHGCSAQAWDVLTSVWREQSDDVDGLAERFEARGYTHESLGAAVEEAQSLGWLISSEGKLEVTEAGSRIRQETEDLTNKYYFGPWSALSNEERQEFDELFGEYTTAIKPEEEPVEAA
jgi:hypothetical protein